MLQKIQDQLMFGNQSPPIGWNEFSNTEINGKSLPIYLEYLNMNEKFDEMDSIFKSNAHFVECFKSHMNACGFKIKYNFDRIR